MCKSDDKFSDRIRRQKLIERALIPCPLLPACSSYSRPLINPLWEFGYKHILYSHRVEEKKWRAKKKINNVEAELFCARPSLVGFLHLFVQPQDIFASKVSLEAISLDSQAWARKKTDNWQFLFVKLVIRTW